MLLLLAAAILQGPDSQFPIELGNRWVYATSLGTELTLEVTRAEAKADGPARFDLETRGLRLDEAWPGAVTEHVTVSEKGVQSHGRSRSRSWTKAMSAYGGSEGYWLLPRPLEAGARWPLKLEIYASAGGRLGSVSTSTTARCLGAEQVALDGRWVDTLRVTWTWEEEGLSATSDAWYQAGTGPVQGRMRLATRERTRELTWTLKAFESDPTRELFECPECGARQRSDRKCHEADLKPFRTPLGGEILERIRDLGADSAEARDRAERRLREIGAPARGALRRAAEGADPEARARAMRLLER